MAAEGLNTIPSPPQDIPTYLKANIIHIQTLTRLRSIYIISSSTKFLRSRNDTWHRKIQGNVRSSDLAKNIRPSSSNIVSPSGEEQSSPRLVVDGMEFYRTAEIMKDEVRVD